MKKFWLRLMSCFLAINLVMMAMMPSVLAGKVYYRLNGIGDGLDVVLNAIFEQKDWVALNEICKKGMVNKDGSFTEKYWKNDENMVKIFNKEIRSNYGNTFVNIFRDTEYNPGYGTILCATARKLDIPGIPKELSLDNVEDHVEKIEAAIIGKIVGIIRDEMLKKPDGGRKWNEIERDALSKIDLLFEEGKITSEVYSNVKKYGVAGVLTTAGSLGLAGSLSGLAAYSLANSIFWSIAGVLGITGSMVGGVTVVAPWIAWVVGGLTNPFLIIPAFIAGIFCAGDTNWGKTIQSVFYIAMMRQKLRAEGRL